MEYLVTDIKEITSKKRLVYINYEPVFPLYIGEIKKYNIKEQYVIEDNIYQELCKIMNKRAILRAMNLLKSRDYTIKNLTDKLKLSFYPESSISNAIDYVSSYGYLDDARYAYNYIASKADTKSRKYIKQQLATKGIPSDIIEYAFDEYYADNEDKETEILSEELIKKLSTKYRADSYHNISYEDKQRIMASYYRKGFCVDSIRKAFEHATNFLDNEHNSV